MWATTPEDERERLSKRNFYRFLDGWRGRTDLLVARATGSGRAGAGAMPPRELRRNAAVVGSGHRCPAPTAR